MWYYDAEERAAALVSAREAGNAAAAASAGEVAQRQAKGFIAELMGGDEVDEDGSIRVAVAGGEDGPSSCSQDREKELLTHLATRVRELPSDALQIVASITGAPSEASFREGFEMLSTTDLKAMRQLFRRMGIDG